MRTFTAPASTDLSSLIELDLPGGPTLHAYDPQHPDEEVTIDTTVDERIAAEVLPRGACLDLIGAERAALAPFLTVTDEGQLYADGTALAESGHEALAGYDAAFKALPPASTALADFRAQIEAEAREDLTSDLVDWRIDRAGLLDGPSRFPMSVGRTAWRQLSEISGQPNINAGLAKRTRAPRRIRTREGGDSREVFGIVSQDPQRGYQVFDGPQVADAFAAGLKASGMLSGAKMTLTYDRESTRYDIRAVVQAPIDVPSFSGVGRLHQLFARVTGGDNGMHGISGGLGALRIRCLNATLVETKGTTWNKRHVGDMSDIGQLVQGLVSQFGQAAESVQAVWSRAAVDHYLDTDGTPLSVQEAFTRLVAHGHLPTGGMEADAAVDAFMSAWREEESPTSAAGILMAVQRAAHETTWATKWGSTEMEEAASALLYQPVYQLASIEA